jgi:predicted RNA-binding protein with PIN domain
MENSMTPGTSYRFEVLMTDSVGTASSFIEFYVSQLPCDGRFTVAPESGEEVITIFSLVAENFADPDGYIPLNYLFM